MKYTIQAKERVRNPDRVWMDPKDCVRMRRSEFEAMRMMIGALRFIEYAVEDLKDRLDMIPDGKQRMADGMKMLNDAVEDLIGTMTVEQCRQVRNTQSDMVLKLMPKLAQNSPNVLWEKEIARGLIDVAREKCKGCVEDGTSCQQCPLYKVLTAISPMEDYNELQCPYSLAEWE